MMSGVDEVIKPVFLLADSQLLFYKMENGLFLKRIKESLSQPEKSDIKAAYIGASNNDNPEFYELFKMAMQQIEINNCRMIKSNPCAGDNKFLKTSDIILLAGGDTNEGLKIIKQNGWDEIIRDRYTKGAILIGVSAGAVQLGVKAYNNKSGKKLSGFNTLQLVPFIIDVHANDNWHNLRKQVELDSRQLKGYGIPFGAGVIFYPDMSIEAVRYSCTEVITKDEVVLESIILPAQMQKEINRVDN